jgi:hypothetical protein
VAEGRRRFIHMPLDARHATREEPRRRLHKNERALDLAANLFGGMQLAVGDEVH